MFSEKITRSKGMDIDVDWRSGLSIGLKAVAAGATIAGWAGVPWAPLVVTAASMGAKLLDGVKDQEDKEEEREELSLLLEGIEDGQEGLKLDVQDMKEIMVNGFSEMNSQFEEMKDGLDDIKSLAKSSFEMLQELRFLEGIENIDAAHETFFAECDDIEDTIAAFDSHRFELKKQYRHHMKPERIIGFFNMLAEQDEDGPEKALNIFHYVVTVEAKYLQMMCVFHIYRGDQKKLAKQYQLFDDHLQQLRCAMGPILKLDAQQIPRVEIWNASLGVW